MALALATSPAVVSSTTVTVTTASYTPPANALLVAVVGVGNPAGTATVTTGAVTDSLGSSWTLKKRQNSTSGTGSAEVWMMDAGASPAARTITLTGSKKGTLLAVVAFTGAAATASQTGATAGSATTNANTISITPTATGSYIVGSASESVVDYAMVAAASTTLLGAFDDVNNGGCYGTWRSTGTTTTTTAQTYGVTPAPTNETEKVAVEVLASTGTAFTASAALTGSGTLSATQSTGSGGLTLHASTPAVATGAGSAQTVSFTPPASSLLVALMAGDGTGSVAYTPTITDSLGAHLTWTPQQIASPGTGIRSGMAAIWTAPVTSSAAMTVTATNPATAGTATVLAVLVLTGTTGQPTVGTSAQGGVSGTTTQTLTYTATRTGSWAFGVVEDWTETGSETAGTGTTMISTGTVNGTGGSSVDHGIVRRTAADGVSGSATTMTTTTATAIVEGNWAVVEVLPPAGGSSSGTASAALTGSGTLTATVVPKPTTSAALAGSGALSATTTRTGGTAVLAIDASTPVAAVSTPIGTPTVTTAAFTPPANSLLVVLWSGDNVSSSLPPSPSITDSLGTHLPYTLQQWESRSGAFAAWGQAAIWTAPVTTSAAMTVTVTNGAPNYMDAALQVMVITCGGRLPAVGTSARGGQSTGTTVAMSYTATATGSWGFSAVCDWDDAATETAGAGTVALATGNTGDMVYGFYRRTTADGSVGATTTLNATLSVASANLQWAAVEITPPGTASASLTGSGSLTATVSGPKVMTNRPAQAASVFYTNPVTNASLIRQYAAPGGLVLTPRDLYDAQAFKDVSAAGGHVLIYLDVMVINASGRYHNLLFNSSVYGPAVPQWGTYAANDTGVLADIRVGGILQGKLEAILELMVSENPHMAGWFADDVGSRSWYPNLNWSTVPQADKDAYRAGAIAICQTFRKVADKYKLMLMVNGTWTANDGGGYPDATKHGMSLADGGFVEHHDGEIAFWAGYANSTQWASQSSVTNGVAFHYAVMNTSAGQTEFVNSNAYAYVNTQPGSLYDPGVPAWGTFHATGLPSKVTGAAPTATAAFTGSGTLSATATVGSAAAISTLTDDFSTQDATKWVGWGTGTVDWLSTAKQVQIACTANYYALSSVGTYTLANSAAYLQLVQVPSVGNGSTEVFFQLVDTTGANNLLGFGVSNGTLYLREQAAGVYSDTTAAYNAASMKWLRIRHDGTNVYWETSPDATTWTVQRTKVSAIPVNQMMLRFGTGYWGTETAPGAAIFDSVNIAGGAPALTATAALTGSGALTATATQGGVAGAYRRGVASSGGEFGSGNLPGTYDTDYHYDRAQSLTYLASRGIKTTRLAFLWERLQRTLGGALDATEVGRIKTYLDAAATAGIGVILDCHNYARYNGGVLGAAGGPSTANLSDLWTRIHTQWGSHAALVGYGLMNEPHDLPSGWSTASLYQGFESGIGGWQVEGTNTAAVSTAQSHAGVQSLVGTKAVTATGNMNIRFNDNNGSTRSLTGPSISAWVYVPVTTGLSGVTAKLQLQDASFAYQTGGTVNVTPGQWTQVTYTPSAALLASCRSMAVQVDGNWTTATGTLTAYIDQVEQGTVQSAAQVWEAASQACVTALRGAGATKTILVGGYNWSGVPTWATSHPVGWITDSANNFLYEGHHYWDSDHSGTYPSSYATEVTAAQNQGNTAGSNADALITRTLAEINAWTSWLTTNNAKGFVGEFGWPQGTADATSWNALASAWFARADAAGLWATQWATGEWWGGYILSVYKNDASGFVGATTTASPILEAHLGAGGSGGTASAALGGSGALGSTQTPRPTTTAAGTGSGSLTASAGLRKVGTLTDNFTSQDNAKWTGWGANVLIDTGRLRINTTGSYFTLSSASTYDLTNSAVSVEIAQLPNLGTGSTSAYLTVYVDSNNRASLLWEGGNLIARHITGGVDSTISLTYNSTAHRIWRIREAAGTLYWEASATGSTWTVLRSTPTPFTATTVTVLLQSGYYATETTPGSAIFDNINATYAAARTTPQTFYVDPAGSDANDGLSSGAPWATVAKVTSTTLIPGDQVLFKRGSSWTGNLTISDSGTSTQPITVGAYGTGAIPIISGGGASGVAGSVKTCEVYGSWVVLGSIEFRGSAREGVLVNGTDVTVQGCVARWGSFGVAQNPSAARLKVLNCSFIDINVGIVGPLSNDDAGGSGVVLEGDAAEVAYNTVSGCYFTSPDFGTDGQALEIYGATNAVIHHNYVTECMAFAEIGNPTSNNNTYHNNVFASTIAGANGFTVHGAYADDGVTPNPFGPVLGTKIHHNTVVLTSGASGSIGVWVSPGGEVDLRNNIVVVTGASKVTAIGSTNRSYTEAGNVFFGGIVGLPSALAASSIVTDPKFVSSTNYRLGSGSPAIDRGVNLGYATDYSGAPRISGAAPDSGAYEGVAAIPAVALSGSGTLTATTTRSGGGSGTLPAKIVAGYLEGWSSVGSNPPLAKEGPAILPSQVNSNYNALLMAFGTVAANGTVTFAPEQNTATLKTDIAAWKAAGKVFILSIGGAGGNASTLSTGTQQTNFLTSVKAIINAYGFGGIDWDVEVGGTAPTPSVTGMTAITNNLVATYGSGFLITMAPYDAVEATYQQLAAAILPNLAWVGYQFYNLDANPTAASIKSKIAAWLAAVPGLTAAQFMVGFMTTTDDYLGLKFPYNQLVSTFDSVEATYPTLRGSFIWGINEDWSENYQYATTIAPAVYSQSPPATADLTGSGALTATTSSSQGSAKAVSAGLTGSGTLTTTRTAKATATATFAGAGTLGAAGVRGGAATLPKSTLYRIVSGAWSASTPTRL